MSDDDRTADVPRRGHTVPRVDALRASVVVVLFVVALALLMGPASNLVTSSPGTTTTTMHHQTPPVVNKGRTTVQVSNGTSVQGLANSWTVGLQTRYGWAALPADSTNGFHPSHTWIYFKAGEQAAAQLLASELGVPHDYVRVLDHQAISAVPGATNDDVVIVIGTHHHKEGVSTTG